MTGALDGVLVADFSRVLAGPLATMLLGDLGADVIKVERPGTGDDTRAWGPPFAGDTATYYLAVNRNKRSVTLDLADPADRRLAERLAGRADVLVENFRPGLMAELGLGPDRLQAANPGLVYCSITGFGGVGPGAAMPGYDFLVQAVGGLMSLTGPAGGEPYKVGVALVDVLTGLYATIGILAALRARELDGAGQRVEVTLLQSLLASLVNQASGYLAAGVVPHAMGNQHPSIAPYETLRAADRELVVAVGNDRQFAALCEVLGRPELATDPRFATNPARVTNRPALVAELEAALAAGTAAGWSTELLDRGVPAGLVHDLAEAFGLAERLGLGAVIRADGHPPQPASPLRLSRTPVGYRGSPPALGAHDAEIRAWLAEGEPGVARGPAPFGARAREHR